MNRVKILSVIIFIITAMHGFTAEKIAGACNINFTTTFITGKNYNNPVLVEKYSGENKNNLFFRKKVAICLITSSVAISVSSGLGVGLSIPFFFFMGFLVPLAIIIPCLFALPVGIILGYYGGVVYKEIIDIEKKNAAKSPNKGDGPDITLAVFSL